MHTYRPCVEHDNEWSWHKTDTNLVLSYTPDCGIDCFYHCHIDGHTMRWNRIISFVGAESRCCCITTNGLNGTHVFVADAHKLYFPVTDTGTSYSYPCATSNETILHSSNEHAVYEIDWNRVHGAKQCDYYLLCEFDEDIDTIKGIAEANGIAAILVHSPNADAPWCVYWYDLYTKQRVRKITLSLDKQFSLHTSYNHIFTLCAPVNGSIQEWILV